MGMMFVILVVMGSFSVARAADYTWAGANNGSWPVAANWGASDYPRLSTDTATFSQNFTAAYAVNLNEKLSVKALTVSDTTSDAGYWSFNLQAGAGTPIFTLSGATPSVSVTLDAGRQALNIKNPVVVALDTPNAIFSKSGNGQLNVENPASTFFSNLNPSGGLNVSQGTLRLQKVDSLSPLSGMKSGTGSLQLDLLNTSTFFTNQAGVGGTGNRYITNVRNVSDALLNPQTLTNLSTSLLEVRVDPASSATFFSSLAGLSSVAGMNGTIQLNNFVGTNNLTGKIFNTSAANAKIILSGNSLSAASTVLNGGSFSTGSGLLVMGEGITLNVDESTDIFSIQQLVITSAHSSNPGTGGEATVNWNATNKTIRGDIIFAEQGGGTARFNMWGGALIPGGAIRLGTTSHDYDVSSSYLTVTGGVLSVATGKDYIMSNVSYGGAEVRSTLTLQDMGVLDLSLANTVNIGLRSAVHATQVTLSDATINLDGGTLKLGKPISRQNVLATSVAGSSATAQVYLNGGLVEASTNLPSLFSNFGTANSDDDGIFVKAGGAVIDSKGYAVTISNNLLEAVSSMGGGLTKSGAGTLTLTGTNTYTGATRVNAGTLSLKHELCLATNTAVTVASTAVLDLDFVGTNVVRSLQIGDVIYDRGIHGAGRHPGNITGAGFLLTLEPPPSGTLIRFI